MSEVICPRCGKRGVSGDEYHEIESELWDTPERPLVCCDASWRWLERRAMALRSSGANLLNQFTLPASPKP